MLGMDVICQAKSGMGKTAVFVISVLQQLDVKATAGEVGALVMCHTRELAYQARGARRAWAVQTELPLTPRRASTCRSRTSLSASAATCPT